MVPGSRDGDDDDDDDDDDGDDGGGGDDGDGHETTYESNVSLLIQ